MAATGNTLPESDRLTVASGACGERMRLVLVGELDLATMPVFVDALASALAGRPVAVDLDLAQLGFIDARGLDAIAAASTRMSAWGGLLSTHHASAVVQRLFDLCGLDDLLFEADGQHRRPLSQHPAPRPVCLATSGEVLRQMPVRVPRLPRPRTGAFGLFTTNGEDT